MTYKAHPYQEVATRFIEEHETACLILDMGLGKTVITLTALWNLILDSFEVRSLGHCPASSSQSYLEE